VRRAVLILFAWLLAAPAEAQVFRWTDSNGQTHYADALEDVPPPYRDGAAREAGVKPETAAPKVALPPTPGVETNSDPTKPTRVVRQLPDGSLETVIVPPKRPWTGPEGVMPQNIAPQGQPAAPQASDGMRMYREREDKAVRARIEWRGRLEACRRTLEALRKERDLKTQAFSAANRTALTTAQPAARQAKIELAEAIENLGQRIADQSRYCSTGIYDDAKAAGAPPGWDR